MLKKSILELTVFVCGALVMIYEIIGSRLLSPYIGTSTYVWTSLIGVILAALSLGYWLGGKAADKRPDIKVLSLILFLAGGLVSLTILFKDLILSVISETSLGLELKSVVAALLLFAPASVLLGFVTPYAVKLKIKTIDEAGKTVGRLYALSTIGSICGTFLAGFFLIPFVGSEKTLYFIGASLIILSVTLAPFSLTKFNIGILVLFFVAVVLTESQVYFLRQVYDLRDFDTEYSRVIVFNTVESQTKKPIRVIATDPFFLQSAIYLDSDELVLDYSKFYHLLRHFKSDFRDTLLIGGAGYTFPSEYLSKYPHAKIDVVEIDPQMTEIAREFFRLKENPRLKIFHEDGRVFLNQTENAKYDVVLIDAFGSLFSVPFQLTTVEAVQKISRIIKDDGIVVFNIGGSITGEASRFLRAEYKTYKSVFPQVYLFKVKTAYSDEQLQNFILVACKSSNFVSLASKDEEISKLFDHLYTNEVDSEIKILTDDLAPVEYYNSFAQRRYKTIKDK